MRDEIKRKIQRLQNSIANLKEQARSERRQLHNDEAELIADMEARISEHQAELKALSPRSLSFSDGGNNNSFASSTGGGFNTLGQQMMAIAQAGIPGGQTDPRLFNAASGLNENSSTEGGFLVQSDFSNQLLQGIFQGGSVLAPMANRIPISSGANSIKMPGVDETSRVNGSRWGGVQSFWEEEAAEATNSKPKFRKVELQLKKLIGLCYSTDELLQDATALETVIIQAFTDEIGFKLDDAIINGTGAGQPLGILNSGALVSVAKESGQSAATVVWENICKMYARMPARNRRNATWLINQDIEPQLFSMSLAVGTGGVPVYMPGGGASGAPYATLFGRPVIPVEQAATLGTIGDIILADLSQYLLADKGGINAQVSIHVRFVYDESVFRFTYRVDGQPSWAAPLTPFKGSNTLSPFVALASRA